MKLSSNPLNLQKELARFATDISNRILGEFKLLMTGTSKSILEIMVVDLNFRVRYVPWGKHID